MDTTTAGHLKPQIPRREQWATYLVKFVFDVGHDLVMPRMLLLHKLAEIFVLVSGIGQLEDTLSFQCIVLHPVGHRLQTRGGLPITTPLVFWGNTRLGGTRCIGMSTQAANIGHL